MNHKNPCQRVVWCLMLLLLLDGSTRAATEVRLDKDFLAAVVEKLPPSPFEKKGQYKGTVHNCRLLAIDASAGGSWQLARLKENSGRQLAGRSPIMSVDPTATKTA